METATISSWGLVPSQNSVYIFGFIRLRAAMSRYFSGVAWWSSAKRTVPRPAHTISKPSVRAHSAIGSDRLGDALRALQGRRQPQACGVSDDRGVGVAIDLLSRFLELLAQQQLNTALATV
ncbi:MAG: hypothetical protein M3075_05510 [Candidatus Dormibacteraeota bacterium]|nr:hypothetical protein [Candidatus Dormibacteraeota bacterium]